MWGHTRKHQGQLGGGRNEEEVWTSDFIVASSGKGETKQSLVGLGLASLNNFSGICGVGAVSSCLIPAPGIISTEKYWP